MTSSAATATAALNPDDVLRQADGTFAVVQAAVAFNVIYRQVFNLTVAGAHTCYVGQGEGSVLTHNAGCPPANLSPPGAGRSGAFNEAKRRSGIPTSQSPSRTLPDTDRRGNRQPGRIYEFDVPAPGGGTQKKTVRDDAVGHDYGPGDPRDRTSTTKLTATMTTSVEYQRDVLSEPAWVPFVELSVTHGVDIGVMSIESERAPGESLDEVARRSGERFAELRLSSSFRDHAVLARMAHETWQPDSAVVNRRGLAGATQGLGRWVSRAQVSAPRKITCAAGIRYCAMAEITDGRDIPDVIADARASTRLQLMLLPERRPLDELAAQHCAADAFAAGWSDLALRCARDGGAWVRVSGAFDDRHVVVDLFAAPDLLDRASEQVAERR